MLVVRSMVLNIATVIWFLMLVVYGAARRTEMREQFQIKGECFLSCMGSSTYPCKLSCTVHPRWLSSRGGLCLVDYLD